jgi:pyruvate kinase
VLANLDAVVWAATRLLGRDAAGPVAGGTFFAGQAALARHTEAVLGPATRLRPARIIVTLPSEAADDPALLVALVDAGADLFRINCAHDGPEAWQAMADHVRRAGEQAGRPLRILMDLAGPKSRTGAVVQVPQRRLAVGDRLVLHRPGMPPDAAFAVACQLPEVFARLRPGHRVFIDEGKLAAEVEAATADAATLVVRRTSTKGGKLKSEKGLNFPDTVLDMTPLTDKDLADLPHVARLADLVGYSFVQDAADIRVLQQALAEHRPDDWQRLGLVAKLETPRAVSRLPEIIVAAAGRQPMAVMIARGDLAVEIGFERLAEMQEEIMWLAEAAHVPVIWATQVLESLIKRGLPSRGEMTDAAMSVRAEAVMLNKGPYLVEGVATIDRLLARMHDHQDKKTPKLRALHSW